MHERAFTNTRVTFESAGLACAGRLYVPADADAPLPCVVMANGFSGTMDWILPDFAERFAAGGLAVLIFDYRHLGESEGEPRHMPALDAVKGANLEAKMKRANVGRWQLARSTALLVGAAAIDALRGKLGRSPRYIPVYGQPGKAFFADPALAERFATVERESPTWRNQVAPRFVFQAPRYREGTMERIAAPVLVTLASDDVEISNAYVREKAGKAARGEVREYEGEHFELYHGAVFERVAADQLEFLRRELGVS